MGRLFDEIHAAVQDDRMLISWHAEDRCEERGITSWQVVSGLPDGVLREERPKSQPHSSILVRQLLADGTEVEVVWSWLAQSRRAKLVTVYFPDTRP